MYQKRAEYNKNITCLCLKNTIRNAFIYRKEDASRWKSRKSLQWELEFCMLEDCELCGF